MHHTKTLMTDKPKKIDGWMDGWYRKQIVTDEKVMTFVSL